MTAEALSHVHAALAHLSDALVALSAESRATGRRDPIRAELAQAERAILAALGDAGHEAEAGDGRGAGELVGVGGGMEGVR